MHFSHVAHAQAVRDRQQALQRHADASRLLAPTPRAPLARRVRCLAARLRVPAVAPDGCGRRPSVAGSR